MRVSFFVSLAAVAAASCSAECLTDRDAQQVGANFAHLFSNFSTAFANRVLSADLTDQTDSVGWLMSNGTNCPKQLGAETLSSRADFEAAEASQPNMPFVIENTYHDCNNVFVRWKFDVKPQQVQGLAFLETECNPDAAARRSVPFLIKHIFAEFNTGAFLVNLGYYHGISPCGPSYDSKRDAASAMPAFWLR